MTYERYSVAYVFFIDSPLVTVVFINSLKEGVKKNNCKVKYCI